MDEIINYSDQNLLLQFGLSGSKLKFYRSVEKKCTRYSLGNEFLEFLRLDKHTLNIQKICFGAYFNPENKKIKTPLTVIQEILFYYDQLINHYPAHVCERLFDFTSETGSRQQIGSCVQCLLKTSDHFDKDFSESEIIDIFYSLCPSKLKYFNYDLFSWAIENIPLKYLTIDINYPEETSNRGFDSLLWRWGSCLNRFTEKDYTFFFELSKRNLKFIEQYLYALFSEDMFYITFFDINITRMTFDFKVDLQQEFDGVPERQLPQKFKNRYQQFEEKYIMEDKKQLLPKIVQHFCNQYYDRISNQYFNFEKDIYYSERTKEIDFLIPRYDFVLRLDLPLYILNIDRSDHKFQFTFTTYRQTVIDPNQKHRFYGNKISSQFKVLIHDNQLTSPFIIVGKENPKIFPLNIKQISQYSQENPLANQFFKLYFEHLSKDYYIFKDLIRYQYAEMYGAKFFSLLPISVYELSQFHNPKDLFCQKYKTALSLPIPWNRLDLNISYLLIKSLLILDPNDWQKLIQFACLIKDMELILHNLRHARTQEYCFYLPIWFYYNRFKDSVEDLNDLWYEISDSFLMAHKLRETFSLQYRSIRRVVDEHDHLAYRIREKEAYGKVKIPKNSKFKKLEKLLPKENFEWIKSGVRLRKEGEEQNNCVFSYADFINEDRCAIYSANIGKNRYTIEFHKNKESQYVIAQMKRSYNRRAFKKDIEYVQSFLNG